MDTFQADLGVTPGVTQCMRIRNQQWFGIRNAFWYGIRNPEGWNPETRCWDPESRGWDLESRTFVDSLIGRKGQIWGNTKHTGLFWSHSCYITLWTLSSNVLRIQTGLKKPKLQTLLPVSIISVSPLGKISQPYIF